MRVCVLYSGRDQRTLETLDAHLENAILLVSIPCYRNEYTHKQDEKPLARLVADENIRASGAAALTARRCGAVRRIL